MIDLEKKLIEEAKIEKEKRDLLNFNRRRILSRSFKKDTKVKKKNRIIEVIDNLKKENLTIGRISKLTGFSSATILKYLKEINSNTEKEYIIPILDRENIWDKTKQDNFNKVFEAIEVLRKKDKDVSIKNLVEKTKLYDKTVRKYLKEINNNIYNEEKKIKREKILKAVEELNEKNITLKISSIAKMSGISFYYVKKYSAELGLNLKNNMKNTVHNYELTVKLKEILAEAKKTNKYPKKVELAKRLGIERSNLLKYLKILNINYDDKLFNLNKVQNAIKSLKEKNLPITNNNLMKESGLSFPSVKFYCLKLDVKIDKDSKKRNVLDKI